jgi:Peptidase propeptide and YPEB domain
MNHFRKFLTRSLNVGLLVAGVIPGGVALAKPPSAKISMADARARALQEVPGTVLEEELESKGGLAIYSFEIRPKGAAADGVVEVSIDGQSGKLVSVKHEGKDDDHDEHEADATGAITPRRRGLGGPGRAGQAPPDSTPAPREPQLPWRRE